MSLQSNSPFQRVIRDPQFLPTLAKRAKWGLFIGACLGVLMSLLVVRNLETRCAAEAAGCDVLREGKNMMMFTIVMQMAFFGALLTSISTVLRMMIRVLNARDRVLTDSQGRPVPRDQVFHSSWNEPEAPKSEAQKHSDRFHDKK